jgi:hypothetical protein
LAGGGTDESAAEGCRKAAPYCDGQHGFLRLTVDREQFTGRYYRVPRPQDPRSKGSQLLDYFEFDWVNHRMVPNVQ